MNDRDLARTTDADEAEVAMKLARVFQRARSQAGLSFKQVAEATEMASSQVHRLESGYTVKPTLVDVVTLANFYRIPIESLVREIGLSPRKGGPDRLIAPREAILYTLVDSAVRSATPEQLEYLISYLKIFNKSLAIEGGDSAE